MAEQVGQERLQPGVMGCGITPLLEPIGSDFNPCLLKDGPTPVLLMAWQTSRTSQCPFEGIQALAVDAKIRFAQP